MNIEDMNIGDVISLKSMPEWYYQLPLFARRWVNWACERLGIDLRVERHYTITGKIPAR